MSVYRYPLSVRAWKLALRHRLVSAVAATVVLAGFVTAGAVGRSRYQLQSEQLARLERRQAALPYYFRGLDLLQRRLDPSTLREVALPALHDAVKTDPSFAEAWFALGEAHEALRNEDGKEAARAYLLALKLQPNNPHWLVRMGDLLRSAAQSRQSEANAKAAGYYRRAAAADPADPFAGIGLAYVRTQENRFDEAIAAADAATQKAPHLWEGWSALAYACSRKARQLGGRKWDEALVARAIPAYEEALRLSPGNRESLRGLAVCYKALGRHDEALELHAELLELDPGDYATYSNRGELYRQLGKLEQARRDLDKAVELAPTQTRLWENRSLVRKAQGDLDGALSDLDEALRLDPANGPAYTARGNIYRVRKQTEEAVADFSKAITYDPNNPIHLGNRGLVYFQTGRFDQARADLRKAIELDPAFEQGWANLGSAEQAAGDTQTAERVWSEGIAAVPSDARGHLLLYRGQLRLNDKRPKLAAEDLSLALQIGGKMAPLPKAGWLLLSRAYRESGQPKLAIATVHSGVAAGLPQQFARHVKYELGDSHAAHGAQLMKAGDPAGALRAYDEALRFDGNPKHAYRAALAALAAGDADAALKRLSKGYDLGLRDWRRLQKDEALKALWEDPRFKALLQRMGAPAPTPSPEGS